MRKTVKFAGLALFGFLSLTTLDGPVFAQEAREKQVVLLADSVFLQGSTTLTAQGNVQAIFATTEMRASKIIYDARDDQIEIEGPIQITDESGVQIFAEFAELDADLQNGLIKSARLVLNDHLEVAADQLRRINGRKSELRHATATSCRTCETGEPPLWQIRASKVIHDQDARQLFFDDAQFRLFDVPIFYLPRLRLPDPSLKRANGFLIPKVTSISRLGTGIKVPYFFTLGDHRDLTVTPFLTTSTRTLEWRYRQAFQTGEIEFTGAVSRDDLRVGSTRAYVFGNGAIDLKRDYTLSFQIQKVSDDAYLTDYSYSNPDRLNNNFIVSRVNRSENTHYSVQNFETLRASEDNETIPTWVVSARKQRRFVPSRLGGEALWELEAHAHYRNSTVDTDVNADGEIDGRDVSRLNAAFEWRRNWITASGLELGVQTSLNLDAVTTHQDSTVPDESFAQLTPSGAISLRYPLIKRGSKGVTQILEPIAQIGWAGGGLRAGSPADSANDESTRVEFDEGNLLALSRFPSDDRRERGLVAAWGLNWTRLAEDWTTHLTIGQVVHADPQPDLSLSSGLSGEESDFLVAAKFKNSSGLEFTARTLVDGFSGVNKAEARGGWQNDGLGLEATYVWLGADADENRIQDLAEWNVDGSYRLDRHWTGLANWRYDKAANATAEAGLGFEYRNECVRATFEVSRRFTSSTTIQPATDVSFTVEILGFSTNTVDKSYARKCDHAAG